MNKEIGGIATVNAGELPHAVVICRKLRACGEMTKAMVRCQKLRRGHRGCGKVIEAVAR